MTEEKKFLERPLAVLALVGGTLGVVATGIGIYTSLAGARPSVDTDATRVADCVRAHGLAQPSERRDEGDGRWYFRSCAWPAPVGAAADGFGEVTVRTLDGPGESEATGMTIAHVFTSTCRDLEVGYLFDNQGTFVPEQPVRLTKGETRRVEGGSVVPATDPLGRDQSVVLSAGRYQLDSVRCV
jgi:hypothetical protein